MIASGILLAVFVVQWLKMEYSTAEKELRKDVMADLKQTSDQVLDTIMASYIPFTLDTDPENSLSRVRIPHNSDSVFIVSKSDTAKTTVNITLKNEVTLSTMPENIRGNISAPDSIIRLRRRDPETGRMVVVQSAQATDNDSMLKGLFTRGMGVFVKKLFNEEGGDILTITGQGFDTMLCKRLLAANWQQKDLKYDPVFRETGPKSKTALYTDDALFNGMIGVELTNKNSYLAMALLPQFAFGFALIVITAGAFLFAWRSYRKQVQLNQLRADFVSNISHELKTPVSTVRVALEALQGYNRKSDPQVMDEYLGLMSLEMDRLDKLVNQVLVNALLEEKKDYLQPQPTDLVQLIATVLTEFQWQFRQAHADVTFGRPEKQIVVPIDPVHVQGVLNNLLDNALKYAGDAPQIRIALEETEKQVHLTVADNGPGIEEQYHDKLFNKFFRVPSGNQHNVKGYGLGLHYCFQVMQQHKGSIRVENRNGCVFHLTFPKA